MEDWKSGRVEERRSGGVEEWKSGRLEEWKSREVKEWRVEKWNNGGVKKQGKHQRKMSVNKTPKSAHAQNDTSAKSSPAIHPIVCISQNVLRR